MTIYPLKKMHQNQLKQNLIYNQSQQSSRLPYTTQIWNRKALRY